MIPTKIKWAPFVLLALIILVAIFVVGFLPIKTKVYQEQNQSLTETSPQSTAQATFLLIPKEITIQSAKIDVQLNSSLEDISSFSLSLNYRGSGTVQIKANPQLETDGWQFLVQKAKDDKIDLAGIYPQPEGYVFKTDIVIATITTDGGSFAKSNFELDSNLTKIISKNGQILTPDLKWGKI